MVGSITINRKGKKISLKNGSLYHLASILARKRSFTNAPSFENSMYETHKYL